MLRKRQSLATRGDVLELAKHCVLECVDSSNAVRLVALSVNLDGVLRADNCCARLGVAIGSWHESIFDSGISVHNCDHGAENKDEEHAVLSLWLNSDTVPWKEELDVVTR